MQDVHLKMIQLVNHRAANISRGTAPSADNCILHVC